MFKKTGKLLSLFLLLVLSFIYTDKVFTSARKNDSVMKQVISYKKQNDVLPTEPIIKKDEIILGYAGLVVNEEDSYKKMKEENKFDDKKIVYESKLPKQTITKTYEYYIRQGNPSKQNVALIFKVSNDASIDKLLSLIAKNNVSVSFFVDGKWLEENIDASFSMVDLGAEIYNLGYDGIYSKSMISVTNNLIESVTLKDSSFCLNDSKDDEQKQVCDKKKMHTIVPTIEDPTITELKNGLVKGAIISYDVNNLDYSSFNVIINTITSRGYKLTGLKNVIDEK